MPLPLPNLPPPSPAVAAGVTLCVPIAAVTDGASPAADSKALLLAEKTRSD